MEEACPLVDGAHLHLGLTVHLVDHLLEATMEVHPAHQEEGSTEAAEEVDHLHPGACGAVDLR